MQAQILIVEDSETQALQLRYLLEQEGWDVVRAATAESALEELNRSLPALIIADYHLPGIQGDEFCRQVRMNVNTRGVPVLMLTMEEAVDSEAAGLNSGADDYVSKAVSPEILLLRVRTLLRDSSTRPAILARSESQFHPARLLAIDDSPTYLECLADALTSEGYDVAKAAGGEEGLRYIANGPFDCVMVDLVMPAMDGIEVCRRISAMERGRMLEHQMAVIMLTSRETKEDMTRGLEAGADDFVGKSSDMSVLKARIRALLRRKFFQDENRRIREQLFRKDAEAAEARATKELAETRAILVEELERKNRELESFSQTVSHDLRGPLNTISGFLQLLEERHAGSADTNTLRYISRARSEATRMEELIDDLLRLSRMGLLELQRARVNLSHLARTVAADLHMEIAGRRAEVRVSDEMYVDADRRLLQVVLENLLGNAWKFSKGVPQPVIEVGTAQKGGVTVYFVRDNGAGFDMASADRLFKPFQRLHSDAEFPGTGVGLATVQRIIERHGGRIWGESAPGRGATFFWTLPAARTDAGNTLTSLAGVQPGALN